MLESAKKSEPAAFGKAVNEEISTRLAEAIAARRADVVSEMFGFETKEENKSE